MAAQVTPGLTVLLEERRALVAGKRVGLLCHAASVDADLRHAAALLGGAPGVELVALFGPEHGVSGAAQDMIPVAAGAEEAVRPAAPVLHSLYGSTFASLSPTAEMLRGLDVLVIDLQDVGARYYTFVATMGLCMAACGRAGIPVVVCDRPNPIGGALVEGGPVRAGYESFVGLYSWPQRHGCTAGELARHLAATAQAPCALEVVPMRGWTRAMSFADTGLPWVLPSPNMPTPDTALVYPGMCLLEGTNVSEGRGTTRPFEIFGAPWIDGARLAEALEARALPGVRWRPLGFQPTFHKHAGQACGGVQLHVTDPAAFRPVRAGCEVLAALRALGGDRFAWRDEAYEYVRDRLAVDLLAGGPELRAAVDGGGDVGAVGAAWEAAAAPLREALAAVALYG